MRITSISLYSNNSEIASVNLDSVSNRDQYIIKSILGLDADEIIPKFYAFGLKSKAKFFDHALRSREIVMKLGLQPRYELNETYSELRDNLYRMILASRTGKIDVVLNAGGGTAAIISGVITKFESDLFSESPEVQITITCDDPMLRSMNSIHLKTSDIPTSGPIVIGDNLSTAPHGFSMQVTFDAAMDSLVISDSVYSGPGTVDWHFIVTPDGGFEINDVLYFSSEFGSKQLYLIRDSDTIYLLDKIDPESVWPIIFPGFNEFYFTNLSDLTFNLLEYHATYWGV